MGTGRFSKEDAVSDGDHDARQQHAVAGGERGGQIACCELRYGRRLGPARGRDEKNACAGNRCAPSALNNSVQILSVPVMRSLEYYQERAQIFTALASSATNEPMARLYLWMAAEYQAKTQGEEPGVDTVPSIMFAAS